MKQLLAQAGHVLIGLLVVLVAVILVLGLTMLSLLGVFPMPLVDYIVYLLVLCMTVLSLWTIGKLCRNSFFRVINFFQTE